jgi:hypothetical protein
MAKTTSPDQAFSVITKLVRPNRFYVDITLPKGSLQSDRIESVEFPSFGIETIDAKVNNQPIIKMPYAMQFQNTCNITFRLDDGGQILSQLYNLINSAFTVQGDLFVEYAQDLWGTVNITALKIDDTPITTVKLINAMVTNVDAVQLSYDEQDSYAKQTVTFSYQYSEIQD